MEFTITLPKVKKYWFFFLSLVLIVPILAACGGTSASTDEADTVLVDSQQDQYQRFQPVPFFEWSQDRDTLIKIYSLKNEARNTYTVISADGTGEPRFMCASRGYPLPADTQLTNPVRPVWWHYTGVVVEQPEANGLFSSKNTDATYVLCALDGNLAAPVYTEMKATSFPFEVVWDAATGMFRDAGGQDFITIKLGDKPADIKPVDQPTPDPSQSENAPTALPGR